MALDWYQSRGLQAMIATATNGEGGMLFQPEERDKGNASTVSVLSEASSSWQQKEISAVCCALHGMINHRIWKITGADLLHRLNTAGPRTDRTLEEYDKAWLQREFGISMPDYLTFFDQLRKGSELWYEAYYKKGGRLDDESALQSLQRLEHWLPALEGQEKVCFDYTSKLIELPDLNNPGSWSQKYKSRLEQAQTEMNNHKAITERLEESL